MIKNLIINKIWVRKCKWDLNNWTEVRSKQEELIKICARIKAFNI